MGRAATLVAALALAGCGADDPVRSDRPEDLVGVYAGGGDGLEAINLPVEGVWTLELRADGRFTLLAPESDVWATGTFRATRQRISFTLPGSPVCTEVYEWQLWDDAYLGIDPLRGPGECEALDPITGALGWTRQDGWAP